MRDILKPRDPGVVGHVANKPRGGVPPVTQEALAARIGTSRWTINSIETGRRMPGRDLIVKIARETGNAVGLEELAA
jgi:plasmid maintenance system antidote protein VapI